MGININLIDFLTDKEKFVEKIIKLTRDGQIQWDKIYRFVERTKYESKVNNQSLLIFESESSGCHWASVNNFKLRVLKDDREIFFDQMESTSSDIDGNYESGNSKIGILAKLIFAIP